MLRGVGLRGSSAVLTQHAHTCAHTQQAENEENRGETEVTYDK